MIFAAASLTDVLPRALREYERTHPHVEIVVSLAGSSQLARQIGAGAPADLFLSADTKWAQAVIDKVPAARSVQCVGNTLVVIAPKWADVPKGRGDGSPFAWLKESAVERVALANPDAVPAGVHARQALVRAGVWEQIEPRLAIADDVRQALAFVARGEAEGGIVYATDAKGREEVQVVAPIPPEFHEPIRQTWVLIAPETHRAAAEVYEWLGGETSRREFEAAGFQWIRDEQDSTKAR